MMYRKDCLAEALRCVCGDRESYGAPEDNFGRIARLWEDYLQHPIESYDVAAMMALLKIARIDSGQPKADNWVDLAGYAACGAELLAMAPAEPDAEIVVRCRGCKYYTPINGAVGTCELPGGMQRPPSDGYCSRGVRRKGQDADDKDKEGENNG